jgi:peptide/nickel transport system permease protein
MPGYILRRFFYTLILLLAVSIVTFIIIQIPPGDFFDNSGEERSRASASGAADGEEDITSMRAAAGADRSLPARYILWMRGLLGGGLGVSYADQRLVADIIAERLPATVIIALLTIFITYLIAIPIGIYSATHQYSPLDYLFTSLGFIGLATPNFLLALLLMFVLYRFFGFTSVGLFSTRFIDAPWSWAKFADMLAHLPIPLIVIGTAGTAGLIRILRGTLLDELGRQYVVTARAKGLKEAKLLLKYPVRVAINPLVSTLGWMLPAVFSGTTITAIVLNLPTIGPVLLQGLLWQDTELVATIVMMLSLMTVIGTFLSDLLLMALDPRIRLEKTKP